MKKLFLNWLLVVSVGNCVSFAVPALVAVTMNILIGESGNSFTTFVPIGVMMLAGSIEGVVLGFAQWLVLHHYLHKLTFWRWMLPTATAAVLAWGGGQAAFSLLSPLFHANLNGPGALLMIVSVLGVVLGVMMGCAQWLVLCHYIRAAGRWIVISTASWAMGMLIIFTGASFLPAETSIALLVSIDLVSFAVMGVIFATITGIALVRLLRPRLV
jgi:hypothetical protein